MFESIRRHQKWLWIVIMTLTIVSFVYFFTPQASFSDVAGGNQTTLVAGRKFSQEEIRNTLREAILRYRLYTGQWPESGDRRQFAFNEEAELRNRLLLIAKLEELGIQVTDEAVVDWLAAMFKGPNQQLFNKELYQQFLKTDLQPRGLKEADLYRFARHEVGLQHLATVAGLPGRLITPREAEALYKRQHEQISAEAIFFNSSNYLAQVNINPEGLRQFYTNYMAFYRLPERIQVAFIKFDATNYHAQADQQLAQDSNLKQKLDLIYQQRRPDDFQDPQGNPLPPDAAKEKIQEQMRRELALIAAQKDALVFANELFEMEAKAENLERLAAAKGHLVTVTQPFPQTGPTELNVGQNFTRAAFALKPDEPFSPPIVDGGSVYILSLKQQIPSEVPPFDSVQARVTEDYRKQQAVDAARSAGNTFYNILTNAVAQGRSFEAVAQEAKLDYVKIPELSLSTQSLPAVESRTSLSQIKDLALALDPGEVSPFTRTREGGLVLRVLSRTPPDEAKMKAALPEFTDELRRTRQYEIFEQWLAQERERAGLTSKRAGASPN